MKKINLDINNIRTVLGRITLETNCYLDDILMSTEHPASDSPEKNRWRVNMNIEIEIDEL